ncbi:MAG: metallophosphoesterase [Thermoplasmata archaeon]
MFKSLFLINQWFRSYSTKSYKELHYISDIHLEYRITIPKISKKGDYLALLGDIGNPFKHSYKDFIQHISGAYEKIFLLTGNHEYWWNSDMQKVDDKIKSIANNFSNVYFLNNDVHYISNDYVILGTTLWSCVYNPTPKMKFYNNLFVKNVQWIEEQINKHSKKKIIMITHHLPSYKLIIKKYRTPSYQNILDRYASHLDYLIKPPIKYWLCGHSHCILETFINGVYCGINASDFRQNQSLLIPKIIII